MEDEASRINQTKGSYKVIDDYVISIDRVINYYSRFFDAKEYEGFVRSDQTKLITCIMVSKPRMNEFMEDNVRNLRNLSSDQRSRYMMDKVKHFIKFVQNLDHESILKIIGVRNSAANLYIFMERYQTLEDYLNQRVPFKEKEIVTMSECLVSGLSYLSSKNIISARLNPDYLVVHQNKIKMNFFCFIKHQNIEDLSCNLNRCYFFEKDLFFYSPQVMKNERYSLKCDIWSLGIVFHYLLSKKYMFKKIQEVLSTPFVEGKIKEIIQEKSEMFMPLFSRMLVIEEEARADISEIEKMFQLLSDKDDQSNNTRRQVNSKFDYA